MKSNGFFTYGSFAHLRCNHSIGHHRGFDHFSYSRTVKDKLNSAGIAGGNNMIKQIRELCDYLRNLSHYLNDFSKNQCQIDKNSGKLGTTPT